MKLTLVLSITLFATGCVSAVVHRLDAPPLPERSPDAVEVLLEAPDQPYIVIAVVESSTDAVFKGFDDLRVRLLVEAAKLGGDAVILGREVTKSTILITATAQIHSSQKKLTGTVIVYSRPEG